MREGSFPATLTSAQRDLAARGLKAMIPLGPGAQPFLVYLLSRLADAGLIRICLVLSPAQREVLEFIRHMAPSRIALDHVVQDQPLGTAHAVLAAEGFAGTDPVVVVNGDNLYPEAALRALRTTPSAGLLGFRKSTLIREGNIPAERINAFALIAADASGRLLRILEKPTPADAAGFPADPLVSMNAWLLPPSIFRACRAIPPSNRGELELQDAVRFAIQRLGEQFTVIETGGAVLDLSGPSDIPEVEARLQGMRIGL